MTHLALHTYLIAINIVDIFTYTNLILPTINVYNIMLSLVVQNSDGI